MAVVSTVVVMMMVFTILLCFRTSILVRLLLVKRQPTRRENPLGLEKQSWLQPSITEGIPIRIIARGEKRTDGGTQRTVTFGFL